MGKVIGKVTDAVGLTDYEGQEKAAKAAGASSAAALALAKEQIKFQKEQYADWKAVYGDIQTNLGDYYKKLTPEKVTALGLENQQKEFQAAMQQVDADFARRGISADSGLVRSVKAKATFQNAEKRADIRTNAEQAVQDAKLGFLGVGLGQGTQMLGIIGNAYGQGINSQTSIATNAQNNYTQRSANNMSVAGDIFGFLSG